MRDLRLIGVHEDGQHLLMSDAEGGRYRIPLDEPLRAAARRDRPRLGQLQIEIEGGMRPREVQALIRGGFSAEEVADRAGWTVEKVRRYEGPILAERGHVAGLARQVRLRGRGSQGAAAPTLAARVAQRLTGRGVDPALADWDSARSEDGAWTVVVTFPAGGRERSARWAFDVQDRTVTAVDDEARWLSEEDSSGAASPLPAPHLVSAPVRTTTVYDVEAEGGVAASARRKPSDEAGAGASREEPLDLMTAMRERASARGRRGRRKGAAVQTPVDEAPREDALPLEEIAYDPETMPPPPAARGTHHRDEPAGVGDDVLPAAESAAASHHEAAPAPEGAIEPGTDAEESADDVTEASADAEPEPERKASGARTGRRSGRPSVPSWDDVMFGAKPRD